MSDSELVAATQQWAAAHAALSVAASGPTIDWLKAFADFREAGDLYADALRSAGFTPPARLSD
jgi:hypothetical protein